MTATTIPTPYNYTYPDWRPLTRALNLALLDIAVCNEFMWMCEEPMGVHQYKHRDTRRYIRLTADTSALACTRDLLEVRRG